MFDKNSMFSIKMATAAYPTGTTWQATSSASSVRRLESEYTLWPSWPGVGFRYLRRMNRGQANITNYRLKTAEKNLEKIFPVLHFPECTRSQEFAVRLNLHERQQVEVGDNSWESSGDRHRIPRRDRSEDTKAQGELLPIPEKHGERVPYQNTVNKT